MEGSPAGTHADDRFALSAERYLAKHHMLFYMEDVFCQLLEHREDNPKVNPNKFMSEYFRSLKSGNHVMFRDFNFIHSTPHNRASFLKLFWKCYQQIGKKGELLSSHEYHSLICLLCSNFPFEIIQKTARIVLLDDALDCLISFSDFLYTFQIQFYYEEFIANYEKIYKSMTLSQRTPREPVVVPTSEVGNTPLLQSNLLPIDRVESMLLLRALIPVCEKESCSSPPVSVLKNILSTAPRVSFYGFLMGLAKSDELNLHIGCLSPKSKVFEGTNADIPSAVKVIAKPSEEKKAGLSSAHHSHVEELQLDNTVALKNSLDVHSHVVKETGEDGRSSIFAESKIKTVTVSKNRETPIEKPKTKETASKNASFRMNSVVVVATLVNKSSKDIAVALRNSPSSNQRVICTGNLPVQENTTHNIIGSASKDPTIVSKKSFVSDKGGNSKDSILTKPVNHSLRSKDVGTVSKNLKESVSFPNKILHSGSKDLPILSKTSGSHIQATSDKGNLPRKTAETLQSSRNSNANSQKHTKTRESGLPVNIITGSEKTTGFLKGLDVGQTAGKVNRIETSSEFCSKTFRENQLFQNSESQPDTKKRAKRLPPPVMLSSSSSESSDRQESDTESSDSSSND